MCREGTIDPARNIIMLFVGPNRMLPDILPLAGCARQAGPNAQCLDSETARKKGVRPTVTPVGWMSLSHTVPETCLCPTLPRDVVLPPGPLFRRRGCQQVRMMRDAIPSCFNLKRHNTISRRDRWRWNFMRDHCVLAIYSLPSEENFPVRGTWSDPERSSRSSGVSFPTHGEDTKKRGMRMMGNYHL